jgi:hypothetical protein
MPGNDSTAIIVAVISLASSVSVAVFAYVNSQRLQKLNSAQEEKLTRINNVNSQELEKLKKKLGDEKSEQDARRDYEYEAKKRLYQEYEPLLFQFNELSESAYRRIIGVAKNIKYGNLTPSNGWLGTINGYYMVNTLYRFLAPLAIFRLMQRRLTLFDLNLNPMFSTQYLLAKILYRTFSKDFVLSRMNPRLNYDPYSQKHVDRKNHPEKYQLQGVYLGKVDNMADALIKEEADKTLRIMSFGEFQREYFKTDVVHEIFKDISNLFFNFHPNSSPVLWRILITQARIYRAILDSYKLKGSDNRSILVQMSGKERNQFNWFEYKNDKELKIMESNYMAAEKYLQDGFTGSFESLE